MNYEQKVRCELEEKAVSEQHNYGNLNAAFGITETTETKLKPA